MVTPLAKPFLDALNRMQKRELLHPEELERGARALLDERFGPATAPSFVGFAPGCVGLMSEHTHFFDGFALLMPLPSGTAVAVRKGEGSTSRLAVEHVPGSIELRKGELASEQDLDFARLTICLLAEMLPLVLPAEVPLDVALVSTVSEERPDAYLSALGVAFGHACGLLEGGGTPNRHVPEHVARVISGCARRPFGPAYPLTVSGGPSDSFALVDAGTGERLALEGMSQEALGWGLVQTGCAALRPVTFYHALRERTAEALAVLQRNGFKELRSFRHLEHRDLQRALGVLPDGLAPIVRYLVSENRRVQKLVAAVRRRDWQLLGALLLMSHAAKRNDLGLSCPEADFAVEQVEGMSMEGLYGATLTGWGGTVVVAGQPFMVPKALDRIQDGLRARFDLDAEVMLL